LQFSGAFRPLYLVRDNKLEEFKGDSMPIGHYHSDEESFHSEELHFKEGDMIYMFTDGYVDQLGGPERKNFQVKKIQATDPGYSSEAIAGTETNLGKGTCGLAEPFRTDR
jgi:serine phosphatase RsbU (regulator of sigma subunit)